MNYIDDFPLFVMNFFAEFHANNLLIVPLFEWVFRVSAVHPLGGFPDKISITLAIPPGVLHGPTCNTLRMFAPNPAVSIA